MRTLPAVAALGLLAGLQSAAAAEPDPLFAGTGLVAVTIEAPFSQIHSDRSEEAEYQPGVLTYIEADGSRVSLDVGLKPRGIFRRQAEICEYPPLRLNFKKSQVAGTLFAGQDKLKLVTECTSRNEAKQFVLKEYLAYRIFNQITERSFRARLLEVTYAEAGGKTRTAPAFLIEHEDAMARRSGAAVQEMVRIRPSELDPTHTNLVELFQYLIGNTDFSMTSGAQDACCHNVVPIAETPGTYYIVPYDFDFAGLVAPRYAQPNPKLGIRSVKQRLYRGMCVTAHGLEASAAIFNEARPSIDAEIAAVPGLTDWAARAVRKYIDGFYSTINDPRRMNKRLRDKCR